MQLTCNYRLLMHAVGQPQDLDSGCEGLPITTPRLKVRDRAIAVVSKESCGELRRGVY